MLTGEVEDEYCGLAMRIEMVAHVMQGFLNGAQLQHASLRHGKCCDGRIILNGPAGNAIC